jgi:hypothetical protein
MRKQRSRLTARYVHACRQRHAIVAMIEAQVLPVQHREFQNQNFSQEARTVLHPIALKSPT